MSYKKQGVPWDTQVKLKRGPSSRELGSSQEPQEFLSLPLPSWHCPVMLQTCCLFMAGRRGPLRFSRVNAMVWLGQIFGERPDFPLFLCKWNQPYSMFSQTCSRTLPMWGAWHSGTSSRNTVPPGTGHFIFKPQSNLTSNFSHCWLRIQFYNNQGAKVPLTNGLISGTTWRFRIHLNIHIVK